MMPLLFIFLAGAGIGGWGFSQADDAIEIATGERGSAGFPILQIMLVLGSIYFLMQMKKKLAL